MAKAFGGMGATNPPRVTANGSPGGIRPMPRPMGLGGVETVAGSKPGFLAQQFGPQGSDKRYEMAMQMLQAAMSGAAGSNSPALAFLTPILGSAIGAKVQGQRDQYLGSQAEEMTKGLLGGNLSPEAQKALEVLNNPNAPDYLKSIASTMFKNGVVPVGGTAKPARRSSGGGRSGGGASTKPTRLTYIMRDPDGVVRGYDPKTGTRVVVPNADAAAVGTPAAAPAAAPALPAPPPDPVLPSDPSMMNDDEFLNALGVQ